MAATSSSILTSVKKALGIDDSFVNFDVDIIMHINSVFNILNQLGVGPDGGYSIADKTTLWSDYIPSTELNLFNMVQSYMYMKVRLYFDPPTSGVQMEALQKQISELEWRLNVQAEE